MGKLLASLWRAVNKLITNRFQCTEGIRAAPVVARKNARVCIVDKLSGFSMPIFEVVEEHDAHVLKSHEKKKPADPEELWARHVRPKGTSSCSNAGAAVSIRQSGNIFDIATALCSRSNSAIGCVNQHRVLCLVKGLSWICQHLQSWPCRGRLANRV